MALSDTRLDAQAAFVARRLLAEGAVSSASPAEVRRAVAAVLAFDRDRERKLDDEVKALLAQNAAAIRGAGADHSEMFRKAKKLLADKKKIPL
ncbi:MAG: DUF507 family protein [Acidobacteria bacterium]|jgi:hypothetical protein|nr:DUF507 family protein [Acidobacteriota bacterium]